MNNLKWVLELALDSTHPDFYSRLLKARKEFDALDDERSKTIESFLVVIRHKGKEIERLEAELAGEKQIELKIAELKEELEHVRKQEQSWADNAVDTYTIVKPLLDVLEWYGDKGTYEQWYQTNKEGLVSSFAKCIIPINEDKGKRAREKLAEHRPKIEPQQEIEDEWP